MRAVASTLHSTSDTELVEALTALETQMRQDYARMLDLLSEIDSRGIATTLGYSNTPALLLHTLRISRAEARHRLAQAEILHSTITPTGSVIEPVLPQTAAALAEGVVGPAHVDVIRATLSELPHLEPEKLVLAEKVMLERAAEDDPRALARFGGRVRDIVDPDGPPPIDTEPHRPERELRRHTRRDGSMEFKGRLDPINAALFNALLAPLEKRESPEDDRGYTELAGDALVDVPAPRGALSYSLLSRERLEEYLWAGWLTWIRKVKGTTACQETTDRAQAYGAMQRAARVTW